MPIRRVFSVLAVAASIVPPTPCFGDPAAAVLTVKLMALRSSKGKIGCTLYNGPKGFPKDPNAAIQQRWCKIDGAASTCPFDPIAPGTYAVACFHDENDNGRLDTGLFGIPTEGTAASNNARG